jgi:hypothetical protein
LASPEYRRNICGDQCTDGINFDPARPLREILMDYRFSRASINLPPTRAALIVG